MKKGTVNKRKYSKADLVMLAQSRLFHTAVQANLADFTAKYPFIDADFLSVFLAKIVAAEDFITNTENQDDTHVETSDVEADMENCRNTVQDLFSYVELAFKGNSAVQNEFGVKEYKKVLESSVKFPQFLERAHEKAAIPAYAAALLTKGWTAASQTAFQVLITKLKTDSNKQYKDIKDRGKVTQDRIEVENSVWDDMVTISICSKKLYYENYAMTQKFLLYPDGEHGSTPPEPPVPPIV